MTKKERNLPTLLHDEPIKILLGKWTKEGLNFMSRAGSKISVISQRIDFLSGQFLGIPYRKNALAGDMNTPEVFVVDLEGVDCFTFIDYIEAMRLSGSFAEFLKNLKRVRYRSGYVAFKKRNHFFTDWAEFNSDFIDDVTEKIGGNKTRKVIKMLNDRGGGKRFLPGIRPRKREIKYIPTDSFGASVFKKLRTGDYAGIYSDKQGLDVSHVGIIIKRAGSIYLRHASSEKTTRRVVDEDFKEYISDRPGIVILRPKQPKIKVL